MQQHEALETPISAVTHIVGGKIAPRCATHGTMRWPKGSDEVVQEAELVHQTDFYLRAYFFSLAAAVIQVGQDVGDTYY